MSGRFSEGFWRLDHLHIQVLLYCIVLSSLPTDSSLFFSDISKESFTGAGVQAGQLEEQEEASEQGRERCSMFTSSGRTSCPPTDRFFSALG